MKTSASETEPWTWLLSVASLSVMRRALQRAIIGMWSVRKHSVSRKKGADREMVMGRNGARTGFRVDCLYLGLAECDYLLVEDEVAVGSGVGADFG